MGTIIFVGCALWFLTENFPDTFGFIGTIFSFLWDIVGNVVMFFVGILSKFLSIFGFLEDGLEWVLTRLGGLLAPVLDSLPDSPFVPFLAFVLLGALFMLLKRRGDDISAGNIDQYLKLTYAWSFSAFNLGMIVAGSGNPLGFMSGAIDTYIVDFPMTMLNYAQWTGFARTMLCLTLIGGLIVSLLFAVLKGLRSFLRTWVGLAFCGMLGYEYMVLRLTVAYWLKNNLGFIGGLLNIPIGFAEFLIIIQFFFGIVVFLLPMGAITAINAISRERELNCTPSKPDASFDEIEIPAAKPKRDLFPETIVDNQVNTWELQYAEGEKAEYRCRKTGARITIWATSGYPDLPHGWRAG